MDLSAKFGAWDAGTSGNSSDSGPLRLTPFGYTARLGVVVIVRRLHSGHGSQAYPTSLGVGQSASARNEGLIGVRVSDNIYPLVKDDCSAQ